MKRSPLKRTPFKRKPPRVRTAKQGGDPTYLCFVRSLPCCICQKAAPSHPHHATLLGRGKSQKSHDHQTMPMCFECHRAFHDLSGYFDGWTRDGLVLFQELQVQCTRGLWLDFVDPDRFGSGNQL